MSKDRNDGGPAYPTQTFEYDGRDNVLQYQDDGMTLRDYFAGQALASYSEGNCVECSEPECQDYDQIAKHCYAIADAMLEAMEAADAD